MAPRNTLRIWPHFLGSATQARVPRHALSKRYAPCSGPSHTMSTTHRDRPTARLAALLASACFFAASTVPATPTELPVTLGSIGGVRASSAMKTELRSLVRAELAASDFTRVKTGERYGLAATLVRLDVDSVPGDGARAVRATAVVSVALTRQSGGTLFALIQGRATAEAQGSGSAHARSVESDALRAAVHSAMVKVPKALR